MGYYSGTDMVAAVQLGNYRRSRAAVAIENRTRAQQRYLGNGSCSVGH